MKKFARIIAFVLILCLVIPFAACSKPNEDSQKSEEASKKPEVPSESTTNKQEQPSESTTEKSEEPSESESEKESEPEETKPQGPEAQKFEDGTMIYFENFDSYGDKLDTESTFAALRANGVWKGDTQSNPYYEGFNPYQKGGTAQFTIENGKLQVRNYKNASGEAIDGATDDYIVIVDQNTLWELDGTDYTIQYDVCYQNASNDKRYIALVWNYLGTIYHSFHFRCSGSANLQTHFMGAWNTMDKYDEATDVYAAGQDTDTTGSSIAKKLLGKTVTTEKIFFGVDVTIRIQVRAGEGPVVWMRVNSGAPSGTTVADGFVKVAEMVPGTAGYDSYDVHSEDAPGGHGGALVLKPGGKIDGTVDNIMIWTGLVDEPADHIVSFTPTPLS